MTAYSLHPVPGVNTESYHTGLKFKDPGGRVIVQGRGGTRKEAGVMGYTHYWEANDPTELRRIFPILLLDAQRIVKQAVDNGVSICGPSGTGEPVFSEGIIDLNGDESEDEAFENFQLTDPAPEFGSCKTSGAQPYDAVVVAILCRVSSLSPTALSISSDGDWDAWAEGRALYAQVFGETARRPEEVRP